MLIYTLKYINPGNSRLMVDQDGVTRTTSKSSTPLRYSTSQKDCTGVTAW